MNLNEEQIMKLAMDKYATVFGEKNPCVHAYAEGIKKGLSMQPAALPLRLEKYHKVIAETPEEVKNKIRDFMDNLDEQAEHPALPSDAVDFGEFCLQNYIIDRCFGADDYIWRDEEENYFTTEQLYNGPYKIFKTQQ